MPVGSLEEALPPGHRGQLSWGRWACRAVCLATGLPGLSPRKQPRQAVMGNNWPGSLSFPEDSPPSLGRQDGIPPAARNPKTALPTPGTCRNHHGPRACSTLCSQMLGRKVECEVEVGAMPPPSSRSALGVLEPQPCTPFTAYAALPTTGHLPPTAALPLLRASKWPWPLFSI